MRLKGYSFLLVGAISLCLLVGWSAKAQAPSFTSFVYEYKVVGISGSSEEVEKKLTALGMQKWELVAVQSQPANGTGVYYLKRQINIVTKG